MLGIGTDIVEIARIERLLTKHGEQFPERILHPQERQRLSGHTNPSAYLAKRFAAKEAIAKALGTGMAEGVVAADIEISNNDTGQPLVTLHNGALRKLEALGGSRCMLSISDEKAYAVAFAVIT